MADAPAIPPPYELSKLSDAQSKALEEFKNAVKANLKPEDDDLDLLRWLIAKNWVVADAITMFNNAKIWRRELGLDDGWLEKYTKEHSKWFDILKDYFPDSSIPGRANPYNGRSRDGFQVVIESLVLLDPHIFKVIPVEEMNLFHIYMMECLLNDRRKISAEKKQLCGAIYMQDCGPLSVLHLMGENMKWLLHITEVEANYYPYFQRKQYFVNCTAFFTYSWSFIKRFIDPAVSATVEFIGSNETAKLALAIPEEHIPRSFGGVCEYDIMKQLGGGPLDKYTANLPRPTAVTIPAWKDYTKDVQVDKAGANLGWEFSTDNYDIGFEILGPDSTRLVNYSRVNSHQSVCATFVTVDKPGKYTLHWDNTFSLTHSKSLKYTLFLDDKLIE